MEREQELLLTFTKEKDGQTIFDYFVHLLVKSTLYNTLTIQYRIHYTLYTIQYVVCSMYCTVNNTHRDVWKIHTFPIRMLAFSQWNPSHTHKSTHVEMNINCTCIAHSLCECRMCAQACIRG